MKKILLPLLLLSISSFGQIKLAETDFFLNEGNVYWQHTYEIQDKTSNDLIKEFKKKVTTGLKTNNLQTTENTITFEIKDDLSNFKKYGGTVLGTHRIASFYIDYLVNADFKDGKYRITCKKITVDNKGTDFLRDAGDISSFIVKSGQTEFRTGTALVQGVSYIHQHFLEIFDTKTAQSNTSDW